MPTASVVKVHAQFNSKLMSVSSYVEVGSAMSLSVVDAYIKIITH